MIRRLTRLLTAPDKTCAVYGHAWDTHHATHRGNIIHLECTRCPAATPIQHQPGRVILINDATLT